MSNIKIPELEKILSFIPIEKASLHFLVDQSSGFDYSGLNQLADQIAKTAQTSVDLTSTKIKGSIYCLKQDVLKLYSEWFNSEIERERNLNLIVPEPWQGQKTLRIERINFQNLNAATGGALIDLNLLDNIIQVEVSGKNLDYVAKIQRNIPSNFEFRYKHS